MCSRHLARETLFGGMVSICSLGTAVHSATHTSLFALFLLGLESPHWCQSANRRGRWRLETPETLLSQLRQCRELLPNTVQDLNDSVEHEQDNVSNQRGVQK